MNVVYANTTTHVASGSGHTVLVILGTHWPANDPIVQAHPELFSDDARTGLYYSQPPVAAAAVLDTPPASPAKPVETATNAPGEKRAPRAQ